MSKHAGTALLSRRYAAALFGLAVSAGAVDAVLKNMEGLKAALENANLQALIANPLMGKATQHKAIAALSEPLGLSKLVLQFLNRLVENRRLAVLPEAVGHYIELARASRGESLVTVVSAAPLDEKARAGLRTKLEQKLGKISLVEQVDSSLLAGVVIRKGSQLLDASLKGRLKTIKLALS